MVYKSDFGSGVLGTVTNPTGQIISYANVTSIAVDGKSIVIGVPSIGNYGIFRAGAEVLIHVSGCRVDKTEYYGAYTYVGIQAVNGNQLVLMKSVLDTIPKEELPNYIVQVVLVAQFKKLVLNNGYSISPIEYNSTQKYGGVLAIKCRITLDISDGKILSEGCGLDAGSPLKPAGFVMTNEELATRAPLNTGNGAIFCTALNTVLSNKSRIGASWSGKGIGTITRIYNYCSGLYNGVFSKDGVFNDSTGKDGLDGATVLLVSDNISGFCNDVLSTGGGGAVYSGKSVGSDGGAGCDGGDVNPSLDTKHIGGKSGFGYIATSTVIPASNGYAIDGLEIIPLGKLYNPVFVGG